MLRKGRREVLAAWGWFLFGIVAVAAPPSPNPAPPSPTAPSPTAVGSPVRLTVEVAWRLPAPPSSSAVDDAGLELELTEGRVVEAIAWPSGTRGPASKRPRGWRLGVDPSGRARARVEAPLGASLLFRAAGQVVRLPLLSVLEGPQHIAAAPGLEIGVERLAWDAIHIGLDRGDGIAAPGEVVPVSVAFNVLTPEPAEVALKYSAELRPYRGGEPLWQLPEGQEVVATDAANPPRRTWDVPLPREEGTYLLEVRTSWEPPAGSDGKWLGRRMIRWRRNPAAATTAVRRVALTVVDPRRADSRAEAGESGQDVDVIDLARFRGQRPSASGRAPVLAPGTAAWPVPESALVEPPPSDLGVGRRVRGLIARAGSETAGLPPADATGLAWSAVGLKVLHPGRPHRLSLTVTGGHPSALGVALVGTGGPRGRPRLLLDACASGPPVLEGVPAASFSWLVWPDDPDPVLVLVNRDPAAPVQLGAVALTELAGLPGPPPILEPKADARGLGLYLAGPELLDRFGGGVGPVDALAVARNLVQYLAYCGASSVVLPEGLADRPRRRALDGQAAEDATGPDRLELLLRVLGRQGLTAWLELATDGPLPGLPPADSPEALKRGLVRVDRRGLADGPAYHPLNPEVREALKRRIGEAASARRTRPALAGVLIRLGPGPTLLGGPDTGLDDATFERFVRETFGPETTRGVPGLGSADPDRFAARSTFLAGPGRMPWLTWRSRGIAALYAELAATAKQAGGGARLAVATPVLDDGPAGQEARRVDRADLPPNLAWRAVGLDLEAWPAGDEAPIVLRGVGLSTDELAHDLATSPELDAPVAARPGRGMLVRVEEPAPRPAGAGGPASLPRAGGDSGLRLSALPLADGEVGDELLGHAMAALDPRWVMLSAAAVAGHEERLRRFARVYRALPAPAVAGVPVDRQPFGVAVRASASGPSTYLSLANDTPYPVRLETILAAGSAQVDDLGRGLRLAPEAVAGGASRLVLDLLPFGVAAVQVGAPRVKVGPVTPYPSEAVLTDLQARYDELFAQLSRLNRAPAEGVVGPPNPGFEPGSPPPVQLTVARAPTPPGGWQVVAGAAGAAEVDPDRPHSGRGSLRLDAQPPPAAIVSDGFAAKGQAALTVQAWFRSAEPDAKVRLWIEGEAAGQPPYRRWSELTVQPEWSARAVRGSELPPGGLDTVRVRLELLTAGRLWVDDVSVTGTGPTEPERQNARRVLLAALHAYRERRYADFARLAGSHWARSVGAPTGEGGSAAERAEMIRTGKATALPSGRLLR